ncbi:hypothetical protein [Allorhizobium undicola]|uniref:hypothetical protein n=1 Tax=Allorhizobium undicola TaxID=78527 RepID=UPI0004870920|nr:hypothetical protein [Allorhizobium undicola]
MKIEFSPIYSFGQQNIAAYILELSALITGVGLLEDAQPDLAALRLELIADPAAFDLEDEADYLEAEELGAKNLASEKLGFAITRELESRRDTFGDAYPFVIAGGSSPSVTVKDDENLTAIGVAVVILSIFDALQDNDVAQMSSADRTAFAKMFEPLFEIISAYALSAEIEGAVWWAGRARGHTRFLRQLRNMASFVGSGLVRTSDQLEENQVGVNDGGVDVFGISTLYGQVNANAVCHLLGATIQKTSRRNKIIGAASLERFRNFFINRPNLQLSGVLAIPFRSTLAEAQNCRDQNCRYYPLDVINRNIGETSNRVWHPGLLRFRRMIDKQLISKARPLAAALKVSIAGVERDMRTL